MLKQELAKVKKNRLLMVTLIVVMLIPSIYSTIFLKSMWDTYERMDNFPVAVINNDKAASKAGKEINIGEELTKTLDKSSDMDFNMMSADEAREGLDAGKYFMAITIPEDFSSDSLTLMDKNPKPMNLTYETSAGHNFTASKFSEIAAGRIKSEVQSNVTRTYAQTVLSQFKKAGLGLEQAGDGAKTLANGLTQLTDGSGKLDEGANKLNDGLAEFGPGLTKYTNGVGTAANGTQQLAAGGVKLQDGINQYTGGVETAASSVPELNAGIQQYTAGVDKAAGNVPTLNAGIYAYTAGVDQAASSVPELNAGIQQYTAGVDKAAGKVPTLNAGIQQYTAGVDKAAGNVPTLNAGIQQYTAGVDKAADNVPTLKSGIKQYTDGVKQAEAGNKQLVAGSKQVSDGLTKLNDSLHSDDVAKLTAGMAEYKKQVAALKTMSAGKNPEQEKILANMDSMATQVATLGELVKSKDLSDADRAALGKSVLTLKGNLEDLGKSLQAQAQKASQLGQLADGYNQLYAGMTGYVANTQEATKKLAPGAQKVAAGTKDVNAGLAKLVGKNAELNAGTTQLADGLQQLQGNSGKLSDGSNQLASGLQQLQANSGKLNDGSNQLTSGLQQLQANSGKLSGGSNQLTSGLQQLQANSSKLNDGSNQLAAGLQQLSGNSAKLTDGSQKLTGGLQMLQSKNGDLLAGANQAVGGINKLNGGLSELNANTGRLQSAVSQLNDGSGQLANGAGQLTVGLVKANDGADELGEKLTEGGEQVKQVRDDKANLDMFATPIKETHKDRTSVKNNGTGMAPYMIAIYVFVGMITLMAAMNLTEPSVYPKSAFTWWLSKYTIPFVLVFMGAIITTLVSVAIIGLTPVNFTAFLISLIVIAIMDMSIVYFFTAAFGKIGTFLSLILLVLQLSASGGTYPIELSSGFFQWLHPYLPMTYAIQALRGSLSTGLSVTEPVLIMFMIFVAFSLLSWLYFAIQKSKRYRFEDTMSNESDLNN
ncbi:YhgE/Pip domain-containing protein [Weissella ceti]|uniref:YhgE/Pip domain-containing protein n=1 Tax=Weissella ceti TaxID=759620 RepID=A0ABT3E4X8_9LACO|nr:YhgE/Pip domain-containing protein [Weissella ceti]MCW0953464.1 YhgE/Pip domain-containing protein [Weissella ceti]QVK12065.1 YhgE/Pip domain-containing protein [Weissella ceti]